jgi:hypothetical protein
LAAGRRQRRFYGSAPLRISPQKKSAGFAQPTNFLFKAVLAAAAGASSASGRCCSILFQGTLNAVRQIGQVHFGGIVSY